ncbi:hypothetical protein D3OALGB2SA_1427 [Olavius algarvensis associated proteobacterium Delta 3]|nr:hypothetical protein D3OALGB2SA_1427 [Olavius algarvensis associated proteobacterium Delta 3]
MIDFSWPRVFSLSLFTYEYIPFQCSKAGAVPGPTLRLSFVP